MILVQISDPKPSFFADTILRYQSISIILSYQTLK